MAKAKTDKPKAEPVASENRAVALKASGALSLDGASPELRARLEEVKDNLESLDEFRLPRVKMTSDGAEVYAGEKPLTELDCVILFTKKTNVYYAKAYNPSATKRDPPDCFSKDGKFPDQSIKVPQSSACKGCPKAEFGTSQMGTGKACRNLKPIYVLLNPEAIMPRQLTITPTSLKAADKYFLDLMDRGLNYRKVLTRIEFYKDNVGDKYVKARFKMAEKVPVEKHADVEVLRNQWMGVMQDQIIDQEEGIVNESKPQEPVQTGGEF